MGIGAIIPAYNEEKNIGYVLYALKKVDIIDNIIVVSDASIDNTAKIAKNYGVQVIELTQNVGKGGAMKAGLDNCAADIILFLDADLIGLTPKHVLDLLKPVVDGSADMTVGVFSNGRFATDLAQKIAPYLSGQRALKRSLIDKIHNIDMTRYGVEVALTRYIKEENFKIEIVELKDMSHYMKEEKLGMVRGFKARLSMYWDIIKCLKLKSFKQNDTGEV